MRHYPPDSYFSELKQTWCVCLNQLDNCNLHLTKAGKEPAGTVKGRSAQCQSRGSNDFFFLNGLVEVPDFKGPFPDQGWNRLVERLLEGRNVSLLLRSSFLRGRGGCPFSIFGTQTPTSVFNTHFLINPDRTGSWSSRGVLFTSLLIAPCRWEPVYRGFSHIQAIFSPITRRCHTYILAIHVPYTSFIQLRIESIYRAPFKQLGRCPFIETPWFFLRFTEILQPPLPEGRLLSLLARPFLAKPRQGLYQGSGHWLMGASAGHHLFLLNISF